MAFDPKVPKLCMQDSLDQHHDFGQVFQQGKLERDKVWMWWY